MVVCTMADLLIYIMELLANVLDPASIVYRIPHLVLQTCPRGKTPWTCTPSEKTATKTSNSNIFLYPHHRQTFILVKPRPSRDLPVRLVFRTMVIIISISSLGKRNININNTSIKHLKLEAIRCLMILILYRFSILTATINLSLPPMHNNYQQPAATQGSLVLT